MIYFFDNLARRLALKFLKTKSAKIACTDFLFLNSI